MKKLCWALLPPPPVCVVGDGVGVIAPMVICPFWFCNACVVNGCDDWSLAVALWKVSGLTPTFTG